MVDFAVIGVSVFGMLSTLTSNIYQSPFREYFVTSPVDLGSYSYAVEYYRAHFQNAIVNGLVASSIFIVVCLTLDRYKKSFGRNERRQDANCQANKYKRGEVKLNSRSC